MKVRISNFLLLLFNFLCILGNENGLVILNDNNFEHLTQAATGATTGDWLVFMVGKDANCADCDKTIQELKKASEELKGRMNVAMLDTEESKVTLRRFKIHKKPTLMFFRLGYQWIYKRRIASNDIIAFATEGFAKENTRSVYKQLDRIDVWQEDFIKELKAAYKERRLPETSTLLVVLAGVFVGVLLLLCMLPSKKKESKTEEKRKKKRR